MAMTGRKRNAPTIVGENPEFDRPWLRRFRPGWDGPREYASRVVAWADAEGEGGKEEVIREAGRFTLREDMAKDDRKSLRVREMADPELELGQWVVNGKAMVDECRRHMRDMEDERWVMDLAEVKRVLGFVRWSAHIEGYKVGKWMEFCVGRFFGVKHASGERRGLRRFEHVLLVTGRGSGKSSWGGPLLWWGLMMDGEELPECYVAARDEKQADVVMSRVILCYTRGGPGNTEENADRFRVVGGFTRAATVKDIVEGGSIKLVSGDAKSMIGMTPSFAVLDEIAQHRDLAMWNAVIQGKKNRKQQAVWAITNAGESLQTEVGALYMAAKGVASGDVAMEHFLPLVYEVDDEDDPLADEGCWVKANPGLLDGLPLRDTLRKEVARANAIPAQANDILRMCFGRWVSSVQGWIPLGVWLGREAELPEGRSGWRCYGGLDLSETTDFSAGVLVWVSPEGEMFAEATVWALGKGLDELGRLDKAPYLSWVESGSLIAVPGDYIDYDWVASWVGASARENRFVGLAFDRAKIRYLERSLDTLGVANSRYRRQRGVWMVEHPQDFAHGSGDLTKEDWRRGGVRLHMPTSVKSTTMAVYGKKLWVAENPALRWAWEGARMATDDGDGKIFSKKKKASRIDPVVALTMAVGFAVEEHARRGVNLLGSGSGAASAVGEEGSGGRADGGLESLLGYYRRRG